MFIFHDNFLINKIIFFNSFDLLIIKHKINMSGLKKKSSGAEYKKRKAAKEIEFEQNKKSMNLQKYFNSSLSESNEFHSSPSTSASIGSNSENTQIESDKISNNQCDSIAITSIFVLNNINKTIIPDTANNDINKESHLVQNSPVTIDNNIYDHDPALWPKVISSKLKDLIISYGPRQVFSKQYPKNNKDRHFSSIHYSRTLPNNELIPRRWLIYSESSDRVYCFCCLCFQDQDLLWQIRASMIGFIYHPP